MPEVIACALCGCPEFSPVLDLGEQPLAERYGTDERYPLVLLECGSCTLVQLSYIADPREVFPPGHTYATGNTKALREHYAALAAKISASLGFADLAVDIGANDGTLLAQFGREIRCVAVEPTDQASKCRDQGFRTWQQFFTLDTARDIAHVCGKAKVITACNVLAHVPDPHDAVAGIAHLLADDGVLITENHDVHSVLDGLQVDSVYAEHNFYWSVTTLSRLLGDHGLVVTDVEKIGTHGGSFRVTARRQRTGDLAERAAKARDDLCRLMEVMSEDGPIYGVGATTRATPLIHYAGLDRWLRCVCEVAGSGKIGLTMPGTQIPVVDEAKLIADQPPTALILAWHIADDIIPALRKAGYKGRFAAPLPAARIIDAAS